MALSRKDVAATVLTVLVLLVFLATYQGWNVPLVGDSVRWATGVIALLGIATCSLGSPADGYTDGTATKWLAALGIGALVLTVTALVTASLTALALLVADIVVLWAISTFRHAAHAGHKPIAA